MTELRVIFFDATGTLIGLPRGVGYYYSQVAQRRGWNVSPDVLDRAFRSAWSSMPAPKVTRLRRPDDDKGWWRKLVGRVLDAVPGAVPAGFDRECYFEDLYTEFTKPGVWDVFPETRTVLARLSSEYRLAIISNFDRRLLRVLDELGIGPLFDPIVISSEVGADKPDPWIFQEALRLAGVRAAETLHVGDDPNADWDGATAAGMRVFRLKRPENSLEDLLQYLQGA
ncbi:MAG: HAD-IA family hydrolase [Chthoniobacteraceae bacterium]